MRMRKSASWVLGAIAHGRLGEGGLKEEELNLYRRRRSRLCTCARVVTGGGGGLCGGDGEWHDGGDGEWRCLAKTLSDVNFFMEREKNASTEDDDDDDDDDKPREKCGVVGIYGDPEASRLCYLALHALQHKGQECAGIVTATPDGFVYEVFDQSKLDQLPGNNAIGHVRWREAGLNTVGHIGMAREKF
nr:amidophosphoribosyltransferase, chloroplastic-like [Tanacetum cinerariifolium]